MYKDKDKQKETQRECQRRYRNSLKGVTKGVADIRCDTKGVSERMGQCRSPKEILMKAKKDRTGRGGPSEKAKPPKGRAVALSTT